MPSNVVIAADLKERAHAMYLQGITPSPIAEELGLDKGSVRQWVHRHGWKQEREKLQGRLVDAIENRLSRVASEEIQRHQLHVQTVVRSKIDHIQRQVAKRPSELVQQATALKTLDDIARRNLGLGEVEGGEKRANTFNFNIGGTPLPKVASKEVVTVEATFTSNEKDGQI